MRKMWPKTHVLNGLGEQQINHAQQYAMRMNEEMAKVDDPREKLKVAESWLTPINTYVEQARENLDYVEPEDNPTMKERGE